MRDALVKICDHNHFITSGRHNFLLQQSPTTTFNQVEISIKFIRAINGDIETARFI